MRIISDKKSAFGKKKRSATSNDAEESGVSASASASAAAREQEESRRARQRERHADASIGGSRRALSSGDFVHYDSRAVQNRKMAVPLAFDENLLRQPHIFGPGSDERVIG